MSPFPPRPATAPSGHDLLREVKGLSLDKREERFVAELLGGNVPDFLRDFVPVKVEHAGHHATFCVSPDYLALGSNQDFFRVPLRPAAAQQAADAFDGMLPTPEMVVKIFAAASFVPFEGMYGKSGCEDMASLSCIERFHAETEARRVRAGVPLGALIAGHMKDIVITNTIHERVVKGRLPVIIFGAWSGRNSKPIQGSAPAHYSGYVDYSHGTRLVARDVTLDGNVVRLAQVLAERDYHKVFSAERIPNPRYPR